MHDQFQELILHVLLQLAAIIAAARAGAWLMGKLGQPQVVGEIMAGLLLGPSVFGRVAPGAVEYLFPDDTNTVFRVLSELGLVLLMFLIGLEFEFSHLRRVGKTSVGIAGAGIVLPFALGIGLAAWLHTVLAPDVDRVGFMLIMGVALSITAIPILGRIMIELKIHRTELGTTIIAAAAIDDALGWILLAAIGALIHGGFAVWDVATMLLTTLAFVGACFFIVRPVLLRWTGDLLCQGRGDLSVGGLSAVLVLVFLSAVATNLIGIFAIFGPFVLGAMLSDREAFRDAVGRRLREFVYAMLLPIFFTYTGLRTDVGLLESSRDWVLCGLVLSTAVFGKMLGCGLAARFGGMSWRESGCVAVMMNTRALMGLIAINVGRELGVVPDQVFSMLVIMAVVTTLMTTPILRRLLGNDFASESPNERA
ncbi:High-affinity Na(+)/H(+) antiporter NhaS3 [Stieleria maiorica]|uniref:High-affinity Na(+)/H(+) antiporter NhaS3 n=1 Tax=Stieleria maiorica TaxID=2795974 RepID=A0A5B9MU89_9BACT|nr:cation:proton antiporter [Stieleria maiorica]QEG02618.1 High-affinity Na(+)/H(+) antiporter NhaS3 [Stieleria maiorica]